MQDGVPQRGRNDKWFISKKDYPFDKYPLFVNAGAYVLSNTATRKFYYASYFVKRFPFDDVYLGFVAWKLGIQPLHCKYFWPERMSLKLQDYKYTIASHGFSNLTLMQEIWIKQKEQL